MVELIWEKEGNLALIFNHYTKLPLVLLNTQEVLNIQLKSEIMVFVE